ADALQNALQTANLPYDPCVQALIPFPSVLKMMNADIDWTARLGNAVLSQRGEVMEAVQRMRKLAYDKGNLKTTPQQKLEVQSGTSTQTAAAAAPSGTSAQTTTVQSGSSTQTITVPASTSSQTIVIQPANPEVVYVPSYNPQVVYSQSPPPDDDDDD